jgi:antitoxin CptB
MDPRRSKLKYRAWRRGITEADLILGPFADARLPGMSDAELDEFETLLDQPDHDLYAWVLGQDQPPSALDGPVLAMIRAFAPLQARER